MPNQDYTVAVNFIVTRRGSGLDEVQRELQKVNKQTKEVGKSSGNVFDKLEAGWKKIGLVVGTATAAVYSAKKVFDFAKEGAELNQLGESFDRLNASVFHTPDLLNRMREASRGTVDDATIMQGVLTLSAGATDEVARAMADAAPRLLEIAKASNKLNPALGDTSFLFESISKGVKRQSPLILDNLGLNIKLEKAYADFARTAGKSVDALDANERVMATLNATMEAGDQLIQQVGGSVDSQADSYERATTALKNYTNQAKQSLAITVANNIGVIESTDQWNELRSVLLDAGASWGDINDIVDDGRAKLDLWRTEADFKRDVEANERGILRMAAAIQALNEGLEVGSDEFNEYITALLEGSDATDKIVTSAFRYARETKTVKERVEALKEAVDAGVISERQLNLVYGDGMYTKRLNRDLLEELEREVLRNAAALEQLNDPLGASVALTEDWSGVLGRTAENAGEFADKLAQQNNQLSDTEALIRNANAANDEYFETLRSGSGALSQWVEDNRAAIEAAKRDILGLNEPLDLVRGRAGFELYVEANQAKQEIEAVNQDLDGIGDFYKTTVQVEYERNQAEADEIQRQLDAFGAGDHKATFTTDTAAAKTEIDRLNDELDGLGSSEWVATVDSNALDVRDNQVDPLQQYLDAIEGNSPYNYEIAGNAADETTEVDGFSAALRNIPESTTTTIITRYETQGSPPPNSPAPSPPRRALGGPIEPYEVYEVGERGREYFVSSVPGYIYPNQPPAGAKDAAGSGGGPGKQQINIERLEISFPGVRTNNPRQLAGMVASELGNKLRG